MFGSLLGSLDTSLFDEFRRLESEMDQLFGRGSLPAGIRAMRRGTFPPVNVGATPERVDVYLFAAGLDPKSLDISPPAKPACRVRGAQDTRRRGSRLLPAGAV